MGTTSYMSPEQARGGPIDARTDIFSFGVLLYEMLGGSVPFRGDTRTDVLAAIIQTDPPAVGTLNSDVPPRLDAVVAKCLEKDRSERYASAHDLLAALKDARSAGRREQDVAEQPETVTAAAPAAEDDGVPSAGTPVSARMILILAVVVGLLAALASVYFRP
jgi:serine/threonine-protein kinase